jgi:hypothetical protein
MRIVSSIIVARKKDLVNIIFSRIFSNAYQYDHLLDDERFGSYGLFDLKRLRDLGAVSNCGSSTYLLHPGPPPLKNLPGKWLNNPRKESGK